MKTLTPCFHIRNILIAGLLATLFGAQSFAGSESSQPASNQRECISINQDWSFYKYASEKEADDLIYDVRPEVDEFNDDRDADTKPTEAEAVGTAKKVLKAWVLPTGNDFIKDPAKRYTRPEGDPGSDFPFVQHDFDDSSWQKVNLPHDWAIAGPFFEGPDPEVGGGMGRLPTNGVAWYRKQLHIPASDTGKSIFLDVDGAMSYAIVWLNGHLVGGWPYGYSSWRVDLTPYVQPGGVNQLAIRLDNPNYSSRWYPGAGIYRNVWLTKTNPVHIAQWGTYITTSNVTSESAEVNIEVTIDNDSPDDASLVVETNIYALDEEGNKIGEAVGKLEQDRTSVTSQGKTTVTGTIRIDHPRLWGPPPTQQPHLYTAVTILRKDSETVDQYETRFGIRSLRFDPDSGMYVNGELIRVKGVNQHHDLGAIGTAFNVRAAERQLEILREMGCNAIRTSHNPPAPEFLELTDRMGFLVMDEAFDSWERKKTPLDFHLIFPDWHEQDIRTMVRRDRNSPSIVMWSYGNEVGEQYTGEEGAALGIYLGSLIKDEDSTRPTTSAMNWAKPSMPYPTSMDVISLNYQGQGIRQDPMFEGSNRIRTKPLFDDFHQTFPGKVILSSETAYALGSRGIYLFPVSQEFSAPCRDGRGGDSSIAQVTAYGIHAIDYGASPDKVFKSLEEHPFVAGEFVWTGWDYIGEPSPYYSARSSYGGILDLAGFKKDTFYLYQSHWVPDLPMVHILPHWNWPDRIGEVTPVHVFTSGDEAELFINGVSQGRKKKGRYEYRLRWDEVVYEPGKVEVIAYKDGAEWARSSMVTTGSPYALRATADRSVIHADGKDLSFITVEIVDEEGNTVPTATNTIEFEVEGAGKIVATDNGDATDFTPFPSPRRQAFSGLVLGIVGSNADEAGQITIRAKSEGLESVEIVINSEK